QKVKALTEELAEETKRRGGDQQGADVSEQSTRAGRKGALNVVRDLGGDKIRFLRAKRREGNEQEAAESTKDPRAQEASQKQLSTQPESSNARQSGLEARTQELQLAHADVFQRVK